MQDKDYDLLDKLRSSIRKAEHPTNWGVHPLDSSTLIQIIDDNPPLQIGKGFWIGDANLAADAVNALPELLRIIHNLTEQVESLENNR